MHRILSIFLKNKLKKMSDENNDDDDNYLIGEAHSQIPHNP